VSETTPPTGSHHLDATHPQIGDSGYGRTPVIREPSHVPLVHVLRGGLIEGVHHGSVVVLAADGTVQFAAGDVDAAFYPRSAIKPLQTVGMLRAGLVLTDDLLALAAASHSGEEFHLAGVHRILGSAGLSESDLRNAPDLPLDPMVRDEWIAQGRPASRIAQNCSGKHAAMLVTARRNGWSTTDYTDPHHPLQRAIALTVEDLTGETIAQVAVDGCGAPAISVSLRGVTRAIARIAMAPPETPEGQMATAIRTHPDMLAGTRRDVSRLIKAVPGLVAKDGFEAVQVAALPDGRAVGVKIADGSARARMPVTVAALALCGVDTATLAAFADTPVRVGERIVGGLRVTGDLAGRVAAMEAGAA
jgi:L-asparaginase II